LLFIGAKDHRITAGELDELQSDFQRLHSETSRSIVEFYQSRKHTGQHTGFAHDGTAREPEAHVIG
jgi:hypothetical protein